MIDLTKITTPFGLLDPDTQEALRKWEGGLERFSGKDWISTMDIYYDSVTYRARPAPIVPDTIDWSHVAPEWKWMARDEDGSPYMFDTKPVILIDSFGERWVGLGLAMASEAAAFASYHRGTVAWQDSLVRRP